MTAKGEKKQKQIAEDVQSAPPSAPAGFLYKKKSKEN
jgi:hypothetical protein